MHNGDKHDALAMVNLKEFYVCIYDRLFISNQPSVHSTNCQRPSIHLSVCLSDRQPAFLHPKALVCRCIYVFWREGVFIRPPLISSSPSEPFHLSVSNRFYNQELISEHCFIQIQNDKSDWWWQYQECREFLWWWQQNGDNDEATATV